MLPSRQKGDTDWSLNAILDFEWLRGRSIRDVTDQLIAGGVTIIQYRNKISDAGQMFKDAVQIGERTKKAGVCFIVNDRLDVAMAAEADGVHLGQSDLPVQIARKIAGRNFIIGGSAHNLTEYEIVKDADYFGVGAVFPTKSKNNVDVSGLDIISLIRKQTDKPLLGIGGITLSNCTSVIGAGADGISVISAILDGDDIKRTCEKFVETIETSKQGG